MRALLIMGPTASGKSATALALAERIGGEIVNADSMQVYADLRALTARPSAEEEARVPHHLYGFVDAAERYSVGKWREAALAAIADIRARGKAPILVGGTGLYYKALTEGLAPAPAASAETRAKLAEELDAQGPHTMHARLTGLDPEAAQRIDPNDARRILRALEVADEQGETLTSLRQHNSTPLEDWRGVCLWPERAALYTAINTRFARMLEQGALEETKALVARGLDPDLPAMRAHGMPWLAAYHAGTLPLAVAAERSATDTRHYAKRQFTWMGNQMPDWPRITEPGLAARLEAISSASA